MIDNTFRGNKEIIETDEYGEWDAIKSTVDVLHEQLTEYELSIPNTITDDKLERIKYLKHVVTLLKSSGTAELKKARKIRLPGPNHDSLDWILADVYWCDEKTRRQKDLSPFERILVESKWTDSILRLLRIGNTTVMRSIGYRLMEQTSEEDEVDYLKWFEIGPTLLLRTPDSPHLVKMRWDGSRDEFDAMQCIVNWIVSDIKTENDEVKEVELKPLDISPYCKAVFDRCPKTLVMSATILNPKTFCRNIGLCVDDVKFIQVQSDFPIENREIYPLNIAHLNYNNLQLQETKFSIAKAVDNIMTIHRNDKGIVHTASYKQLKSIKENLSEDNLQRLLVTDPNIQREEVIAEHIDSTKPTVLISPSLNIGIDLKDELSRFQIITKIPYPNLADRWINAKRDLDNEWYNWQTALRLVQAYGRSVRSKEDWAKTYILDSGFGSFVNKNKNIFPDWFKQAIR